MCVFERQRETERVWHWQVSESILTSEKTMPSPRNDQHINVGIAIINHPPNHHKWIVQTIKNGWFIIAMPTLLHSCLALTLQCLGRIDSLGHSTAVRFTSRPGLLFQAGTRCLVKQLYILGICSWSAAPYPLAMAVRPQRVHFRSKSQQGQGAKWCKLGCFVDLFGSRPSPSSATAHCLSPPRQWYHIICIVCSKIKQGWFVSLWSEFAAA